MDDNLLVFLAGFFNIGVGIFVMLTAVSSSFGVLGIFGAMNFVCAGYCFWDSLKLDDKHIADIGRRRK